MSAILKRFIQKKRSKKDREQAILLGIVDLFIRFNKPVGSQTLKENGFDYLSSATIRNYFQNLEDAGYLTQKHSSGGRIPTTYAYREYMNFYLDQSETSREIEKKLRETLNYENKEFSAYLNEAAEILSDLTKCPVFLIPPIFEQDYLQNIKFVKLGKNRLLCILITEFGLIYTEILHLPKELNGSEIQNLEQFFLWRLGKEKKPLLPDEGSSKLAQYIYNEIMLRHVIHHAHSSSKTIYRTGLSQLLSFPEFKDPTSFAQSLHLFEDLIQIGSLLNECIKVNRLTGWIGEELLPFSQYATNCSILAIPYYIHHFPIGAVAILGPQRLPYNRLIPILQTFSSILSETLTKTAYKYKIQYRPSNRFNEKIPDHAPILLEDKAK